MNIFPESDASCYVKGIICLKHFAMCQHTYSCLSNFCLTHQVQWSKWNRIGSRRTAILLSRQIIENRAPEEMAEIKITPGDAYFVRTEELCTPIDKINLEYHLDPPTQEV